VTLAYVGIYNAFKVPKDLLRGGSMQENMTRAVMRHMLRR